MYIRRAGEAKGLKSKALGRALPMSLPLLLDNREVERGAFDDVEGPGMVEVIGDSWGVSVVSFSAFGRRATVGPLGRQYPILVVGRV